MFDSIVNKCEELKFKFDTYLNNNVDSSTVSECKYITDNMINNPENYRMTSDVFFDKILSKSDNLSISEKLKFENIKQNIYKNADKLFEGQVSAGRNEFLAALLTLFYIQARLFIYLTNFNMPGGFFNNAGNANDNINDVIRTCIENPIKFCVFNCGLSFIIKIILFLIQMLGTMTIPNSPTVGIPLTFALSIPSIILGLYGFINIMYVVFNYIIKNLSK